MTKRTGPVFPDPIEGTDNAYCSGYHAGFAAAIKKADELAEKVAEMQAEVARYDRTVTDLEIELALANSRAVEAETVYHTDMIICTETDADLLKAAKSMLGLLDVIQTILKIHGSNFPITENLAVLNLKTAIKKAEGLE